jgi:hypothetical protein
MVPFILCPSQRSRIHFFLLFATLLATQLFTVSASVSDSVLDWVAITNDTAISAGSSPLVTSRVISLVSASVFDAVNGIEPRYRPLHVRPDAPRHASAEALRTEAARPLKQSFCLATPGELIADQENRSAKNQLKGATP